MVNNLLEVLYIISGIIILVCGIYAYKNKENKKRIGSALFWIILGFIFIFGKVIPSFVVGIFLIVLALLTATKNVSLQSLKPVSDAYKEEKEKLFKNLLFIPAISIGLIAFLVAQFTKLGGLIGLGIGAMTSLILCIIITKEKASTVPYESSRMLQQMGPSVILPQLLASLGGLFAEAGVGEIVANIMKGVIPADNKLFGVIGYCVSMAVFTIVMGNAFAAFAVITAGIGIPFVIALGGDTNIVSALGLTAGFCGTLMTPMAANFNMIPASILEMENKNGVILEQIPVALILLVINTTIMYLFAFR